MNEGRLVEMHGYKVVEQVEGARHDTRRVDGRAGLDTFDGRNVLLAVCDGQGAPEGSKTGLSASLIVFVREAPCSLWRGREEFPD